MLKNTLIKNKVYLYLLAFYDGNPLPPATVLAKQIGITRQTVSKKYKELQESGVLSANDQNLIIIKNEYNIDKETLKNFLQNNSNYTYESLLAATGLMLDTRKDIEREYGISVKTLKNEETKDNEFCYIYGIVLNGELEYVGSTNNLDLRKKQHMARRSFLKDENFIIIKKLPYQDKLEAEKINIKTYNPDWNEVSKLTF